MTRPGIEPRSPGSLVNILELLLLLLLYYYYYYYYIINKCTVYYSSILKSDLSDKIKQFLPSSSCINSTIWYSKWLEAPGPFTPSTYSQTRNRLTLPNNRALPILVSSHPPRKEGGDDNRMQVPSGPLLVSRNGAVRWTKHLAKVPNVMPMIKRIEKKLDGNYTKMLKLYWTNPG